MHAKQTHPLSTPEGRAAGLIVILRLAAGTVEIDANGQLQISLPFMIPQHEMQRIKRMEPAIKKVLAQQAAVPKVPETLRAFVLAKHRLAALGFSSLDKQAMKRDRQLISDYKWAVLNA